MTQAKSDPRPDFLGLAGKKLLVTGASSGIGRATAIEASRHGAKVALLGRRIPELNATLDEMIGSGHLVSPFDLTLLDEIPEHVVELAARFGGLDGIVHAAGIHSARPLRMIDAAELDDILRSNLSTAFMLAKGFRTKLVEKKRPSLVFVSSVMANVGQAGVTAYAASKGGLSALTKSLALELARDGIRVNAVEPGIVLTEMTERLRAHVGTDGFAAIEAKHPFGIGTPLQVANAILFLLSDAASWITGTSLVVDGGYTAQ
jgi:NAD(P)-dependent dehydrogenase (short-subunit alcohol dehydrogenase family)